MENKRGKGGDGQETAPPCSCRQIIYDDVQPYFDWTQDCNSHILTVHLPGFVKEELKLQVNDNGRRITVGGERRLSEYNYIQFKQVFNAPADSNIRNISGKFEKGLLYVIMPKDLENGPIEKVLDQISKNKAIIATAVLSFSLGMKINKGKEKNEEGMIKEEKRETRREGNQEQFAACSCSMQWQHAGA
ncbi:hypothetical protein AAC387_Pa01g2523 [Persea americana]